MDARITTRSHSLSPPHSSVTCSAMRLKSPHVALSWSFRAPYILVLVLTWTAPPCPAGSADTDAAAGGGLRL